MRRKDRIRRICDILKTRYPDVKTQLNHRNPFELLAATILSAQCTDRQVNSVTEALFKVLATPEDFARAHLKRIEDLIRPTGYFRNKAKHLKNCGRALMAHHGGRVPENLEDLVALPGVGRKTANVVLGAAFGVPGVVVDTHVARISRRLGFTKNQDPVKIEFDLMKILPRTEWNDFCLHLIYFGREICSARKPRCPDCPVEGLCPFPEKSHIHADDRADADGQGQNAGA